MGEEVLGQEHDSWEVWEQEDEEEIATLTQGSDSK